MTFDLMRRLGAAPDWSAVDLGAMAAAGLLVRDASLDAAAARVQGRLVYLATPYTKLVETPGGWDRNASLECAVRAARWARALALRGCTAISPIVQAVEMVHAGPDVALDPLDDPFWTAWCRPLLAACHVIVVPPVPGWDESRGVWLEALTALSSNRQVVLIGGGHV